MPALLKSWRASLLSGPDRIALSTALRGTIATATPLAVLPHLGAASLAYPAVLGALATSMVDVGGPYRSRLVGMLIQTVGGTCLLLLGSLALGHWWLAALVMAALGILSGLIRALGPGGASLGINTAVAFLVGLQLGEAGGASPAWLVGYGAGGFWTILTALAFWQLRPYRRLEQEVAGAWEAVAALVAAIAAAEDSGVVARRRREQRIAAAHGAAREAVERAREALGEMRAGTAGPGTTVSQLVVLLNAAARIGAATVTLGEVAAPAGATPRADEAELERECRAVARILLAGKGAFSPQALRGIVQAASGELAESLAWAQALRHLDNAQEALRLLFGEKRRLFDLLHLAFTHRRPKGTVLAALRLHANPRSPIFRHALRVASVTAIDTGVIAYFRLPHGIWLPLTSLVILQPDYGGTVARALERSGGTILGAVIAGALLAGLRGTVEYDAALGLLLFLTFLLIRRRYGYAITFLTPLIILLIGMASADPWIDLAERIAYTIAGALLAIAAFALLWPQWEREQLGERLVRAVGADRDYLAGVLAGLATPDSTTPALASLRRQAELAIANAEAGFQRMLTEPATRRAPAGAGFALLIYLNRLCRTGIALAAQQGAVATPGRPLAALAALVEAALADAASALAEHRAPAPRPDFDHPLAELAAALRGKGAASCDAAVAALLGRLISDVTGLITASTRIAAPEAASGKSR